MRVGPLTVTYNPRPLTRTRRVPWKLIAVWLAVAPFTPVFLLLWLGYITARIYAAMPFMVLAVVRHEGLDGRWTTLAERVMP